MVGAYYLDDFEGFEHLADTWNLFLPTYAYALQGTRCIGGTATLVKAAGARR